MRTVSVFSSQANLPLSDINRQDNKTLRAQFRIIFSNQRLISCQFAFTLPRMWRFYHHAVKESQARTTGALISYTYCLHEMVCTYTDSTKMVEHFHKGHLETPRPKKSTNKSFIDSWYWRSFRTKPRFAVMLDFASMFSEFILRIQSH